MSTPLVSCPTCARHVRGGAERCPFCDTGLSSEVLPSPNAPLRTSFISVQMSRIALVAVGVTVFASALVVCGATRYGAPPAPSDELGFDA